MKDHAVPALAVSPEEAARVIGISRRSVYEYLRRGELNAKKAGNRTLILISELERFLGALPNLDLIERDAKRRTA